MSQHGVFIEINMSHGDIIQIMGDIVTGNNAVS